HRRKSPLPYRSVLGSKSRTSATTYAPSPSRRLTSHDPIIPVAPVTSTRRFDQRFLILSRPSMEPYPIATAPPTIVFLEKCPLAARSPHAGMPLTGRQRPSSPMVPVPKSSHRP